jgi:hypothetical protein
VRARRPDWDFDYAPVVTRSRDEGRVELDLIVATTSPTNERTVVRALRDLADDVVIETVVDSAPIHWLRARGSGEVQLDAAESALHRAGIQVRYVASAIRGSLRLPPQLICGKSARVRVARPRPTSSERSDRVPEVRDGDWFRGPLGANVDRTYCGGGGGTRIAVIDDDAADLERVQVAQAVPVGVSTIAQTLSHGTRMVAWATGAITEEGARFEGIAPASHVSLYCIPKPETDISSLPIAIVRAVLDGADVIVCATYVEGSASPMLDDAIELARRCGRRGRGTIVIFPTGRETSSFGTSVHSSLSLALGAPATDPRAFCIGPSGRGGGWFLWRDRKGALRPFANRGPGVRWLAPGDDLAHPFSSRDRLAHGESSAAAAIATGVVILVLSKNPSLRGTEVDAILTRCCEPVPPLTDGSPSSLADPSDLLPVGIDRDGHNAKHGYGRLDATRACVAASDPIALALVTIGDDDAARAVARARIESPRWRCLYSQALARWAVRALLADASASHSAAALARHGRLLAHRARRASAQHAGSFARGLALTLRMLATSAEAPRPSRRVSAELLALETGLRSLAAAGDDGPVLERVEELWTVVRESFSPPVAESTSSRLGDRRVPA